MVPKGWQPTTLGEILTFKNGLNFSKSSSGESIKIVGVKDFKDLTELKDTSTLESIQVESKIRDAELLRSGDLLFVRSNGNKQLIGRCLFFPSVNERLSFSGFTIRGRVSDGKTLPVYASHLVRSELIKSQFSKNGAGTNISNLSQDILSQATLNLPPTAEQTKIAQILSTWDKAIATTERVLANSQQQKQALMQQLLTGTVRSPNAEGEWHEVEIGNIIKEVKRPVVWDDDAQYRLLSVKRRAEGVVLREVLAGSQILTKKMNTARAGDFLISKMQVTHGAMGLVTDEFDNHHISDSYIAVIAKDPTKLDINYFSWLGRTKALWRLAFLSSYGVHIEKLTFNFSLFLKEKINIPTSLAEQQKIAQVLSTADAEIANLQAQLAALKLEKKALMQQLLTGQRRVKLDDAAA